MILNRLLVKEVVKEALHFDLGEVKRAPKSLTVSDRVSGRSTLMAGEGEQAGRSWGRLSWVQCEQIGS